MPSTRKATEQPQQTQLAEDETSRAIGRGPKASGHVPGASPAKSSRTETEDGPPTQPDETLSIDEQKKQAVALAVAQLGKDEDPSTLAEVCHAQAGIDMSAGEVAAILTTLKSATLPTDQAPPECQSRPPR